MSAIADIIAAAAQRYRSSGTVRESITAAGDDRW